MTRNRATLLTLIAASAAILLASPTLAGELDRLAEALSLIRGEVEVLSTEIRDLSEERRTRLRSLSTQRADLELEVKREELRLRQLEDQKQALKNRSDQEAANSARLGPAAEQAIATVRTSVQDTLPFQRQERLAELDALRDQLKEGLITPQQALWRLWERVEDEQRLSRENAIHQQIIELDGEPVLADVARLGMAMMAFRTQDGRFGKVQRGKDGAWRWVELDTKEDRARVASLFDALRKNIRVGYFELPYLLPQELP